jgi:hypothetical protein
LILRITLDITRAFISQIFLTILKEILKSEEELQLHCILRTPNIIADDDLQDLWLMNLL